MPLTTEALAFLDAIAVGENNIPWEYTELCGGGRFSDLSHFPNWPGVVINGAHSHAAGRYQFEPETWYRMSLALGLRDFTPDAQDSAAWKLAATVYRQHTTRDLQTDLVARDLAHVPAALHSTWPSITSSILDRFQGAYTARQTLRRFPGQPGTAIT